MNEKDGMTWIKNVGIAERRFWSYVDRSSGPDSCWPWLKSTNIKGYGTFGIWLWGRKIMRSHRIAFALQNGHWPRMACHRCDNPSCCNPAHIYDGDPKKNAEDMVRSGRHWCQRHPHLIRRGEDHYGAVLTKEQVEEIRVLYGARKGSGNRRNQVTYKSLGIKFGVSPTTIGMIVRGVNWKGKT